MTEPKKTETTPGGLSKATLDQINSLVVSNTARNETIDRLAEQNHALSAQIGSMQQQIAAVTSRLHGPAPTEPTPNPLANLIAPGQIAPYQQPAAPQQLGIQDIAQLITQSVSEAVKPINDRLNESDELTSRRAAQQASMAKAVQSIPSLRDPNSQISQVFERILEGRPDLQELDDAPQIAAMVAQGIVAGSTQETEQKVERKVAASVAPGRAPLAPPAASYLQPQEGEYEQSKALTASLVEKGSQEGLSDNERISLVGNLLAQGITEQVNPELNSQ